MHIVVLRANYTLFRHTTHAIPTPSSHIVPGSGAVAMNPHPKFSPAASVCNVPAGLLTRNDPAASVTKYRSELVPVEIGLMIDCPKFDSSASVAPVAPLLLSNVIPAQNSPAGSSTPVGLKV